MPKVYDAEHRIPADPPSIGDAEKDLAGMMVRFDGIMENAPVIHPTQITSPKSVSADI